MGSGLLRKIRALQLKGDISSQQAEEDRRISMIGPSQIIDHSRHIEGNHLDDEEKNYFLNDLELRALQWELPRHFLPLFNKGVSTYLAGKWQEARKILEVTRRMVRSEQNGPSNTLLKYMERRNFQAPADRK